MENAVFHFLTEGKPVSCADFGHGHINDTFLIQTDRGKSYILQQINTHVFRYPEKLMDNVVAVSGHIRKKSHDRSSLNFIRTDEDRYFHVDETGRYWRCYEFIPGLCLEKPETDADLYECAVAFGSFQELLSDFPAENLFETIPEFHNTPSRILALRCAADRDLFGRSSGVKEELEYILSLEPTVSMIRRLLESEEIPLRVTHNDTKLNNVLLDPVTRKALCVLDLDTVMPGSVLFDFGDAVRSGASTSAEDARDLSQIGLDLHLFETYTEGFLSSCHSLTGKEVENLPLGALTMTAELAARFLTDYLEGDHYFKTDYPDHNLVRARAQIRLAQDMSEKMDKMTAIVDDHFNRQKSKLQEFTG